MSDVVKGKNCKIDNSVMIGYMPGRAIDSCVVKIGRDAVIRSGTVIYAGVVIGDEFETGHNVVVREENVIGNRFSIWNNSVIDYGCIIGNNVKIHSNVYVAQFTIIEDDVFIAPGVTIANDLHPICAGCMKGPTIKRGARIGINSSLCPHIIIGEYSLIGAGSVVTTDIPPHSVAYGSPARVHGSIYDLKCKMGVKEKAYSRKDDQ